MITNAFIKNWGLVKLYIFNPYKKYWCLFILLSVIAGCLPASIFYALAYIINHIKLIPSVDAIPSQFIAILCLMLIALPSIGAIGQLQYLVLDHLRDLVKVSLKQIFLETISNENNLAVLENKESATLLAGASTNFEALALWIDQIGIAIMTACGAFFLLLLGSTLSWWLPITLLLGAIPVAIIRYKIVDTSYRVEETQASHYQHLAMLETILTQPMYFKELRIFGLKEHFLTRWKHYAHLGIANIALTRKAGLKKTLLATLFSALIASTCVFYFIWAIVHGKVLIGALVIIIGLVLDLGVAINALIFSISRASETATQVLPLLRLIKNIKLAKYDGKLLTYQPSATTQIEIKNLSFCYADIQKDILKNVSFAIQAGQKVAIVGENGAGKTTLMKLVAGLLLPCQGNISVNGHDLATLDKEVYWNTLGVVFQDFARFPVSANLNVALGDISRLQQQQEVSAVMLTAGIEDLANYQIDNEYEEESFSGGQWQRLALARALFRNHKTQLILLDEPTSALDPNAEHALFDKFLELSKGKTTIFVTHRMALAREADVIIVLEAGCIAELGTHEALLQQNGTYAIMYGRQASRYT